MFEFKRLCDSYEALTGVERGILLEEKTVTVMAKLHSLAIPGIDPVSVLAGFIIGSVAADGRINEKEYVMIYPALVRAFGGDFDFASVKESFRRDKDGRRMIAKYTEQMIAILDLLDEDIKNDIITLCLCIVAIDGKISFKEKNYIKRLCRAS